MARELLPYIRKMDESSEGGTAVQFWSQGLLFVMCSHMSHKQ
jgi:hypothetical protein